jgi:hypothetical protein
MPSASAPGLKVCKINHSAYTYAMNSKQIIMIAMVIGTSVGSAVPLLWGAGFLSLWSVFFTAIGGFAGIYIGYKMTV